MGMVNERLVNLSKTREKNFSKTYTKEKKCFNCNKILQNQGDYYYVRHCCSETCFEKYKTEAKEYF
ncbi:hypothetical protein KKB11_01880 [Candidatus Micrarchaeota archaeon]|nr:hypothetical protein [Candidatus Micrarchaeota archaeon]